MTSEISSPYAVLVVEDDPLLRMHAVDIVEDAGFTAIEEGRRRSYRYFGKTHRHHPTFHRHSDAGLNGWFEAGACGARPVASDQDRCRIWTNGTHAE
jgi:hypothetical protein